MLHRLRVNDTKHLQEVLRAMKASVLARRDKGRARNEMATHRKWMFSRPARLETILLGTAHQEMLIL